MYIYYDFNYVYGGEDDTFKHEKVISRTLYQRFSSTIAMIKTGGYYVLRL